MKLSFPNLGRAMFAAPVFAVGGAAASGSLVVEQAWIRAAPPGARMLAGYATLANSGDTPITVVGAHSTAFDVVSMHETVIVDGVSKMRPLERIAIAPGQGVALAPGGKHLMMTRPSESLAVGADVKITFELDSGAKVSADFAVREDEPH